MRFSQRFRGTTLNVKSGDLKFSPSLSALAPGVLKRLTQHVEMVLVLFLIPVVGQMPNGDENSAPNNAGRYQ